MASYIGNNLADGLLKTKRAEYVYTVSNATSVSGLDDNSKALSTPALVDVLVFVDGALLSSTDYTVGSDVVNFSTAQTGEVVVITELQSALINAFTRNEAIVEIDNRIATAVQNIDLDDLTDVDLATNGPQIGQTIIWDGTKFVPGDSFNQSDFDTAFTAKDTDDLSEGSTNLYYTDTRFDTRLATKSTTDLAEGTNLYYTDARADARVAAANIGVLNNVNTAGITVGDFLLYDGTEFLPVDFATEVNTYADTRISLASIQDLSDVDSVDAPANGDTLVYDGTEFGFVNFNSETNSLFDIRFATKSTTDLAEGTNLYYTDARADARIATASIDDLSDVNTTTTPPTSGQSLIWNGTTWIPGSNETLTSLGIAANVLTYTDEAGASTNIDLSLYLDDTNLAYIVSGSVAAQTGIATFTRSDSSSFTVDFSAFLDDTNLTRIDSATFASGTLTLTRGGDGTTVTVNLDGRYLQDITSESIGDLSDVDITTVAPTANQALVWDAVNSKFIPGDSFSQSDFDTAFTAKDTDDLSEGTTNLYYTDARVGAYLTANPQPGNTYGTQIVWDVSDPTNSIILDAGDGSTTQATYYGDVVDSNGSAVLDISGPAFYGSTNGNHNGDVYDATGNALILDVDNGQGIAVLNGDVNGTNITTSNIDVSNYIKGYNSLIASGAGATVNYVVTVAAKTAAHRYNGTGSSSGYVFNGLESPFLTLTPGRTYRFIQEDATNSGHVLAFYFEADKTTAYTDNVTFNGTPGQSGAYTEITITDSTPAVLHYQCTAHGYMGNSLQTNTRNLTGWTTDNLIEGTSLYYTDARVDARITAASIDDLSDVDITTTAPTANQALVWDAVNSKFIPGDSFSQSDFDTAFTAKDTDDLSEGTTNLYYTDTRANAAIDARVDKTFVEGLGIDYSSITNPPTDISDFTDTGSLLGANVTVGATAPTSPAEGDLWYDTNVAELLVYDGAAWVTTADGVGDFFADNTTDDLSEGTSNLYYTDARVQAYLAANNVGAEVNDLTASVTWANVPDANITESSVTQHEAALTITESQISDLQSYLTGETITSLVINGNILTYVDEAGAPNNIDLSLYLDDTNLARLVSGTLNGTTGIATFTRDDSSTFTVDFSPLFDDTNLSRIDSASFANGTLTLTRNDASTAATVSLDGRYLQDLSAQDTDDLAEGTTNLYYTDARVQAYLTANNVGAEVNDLTASVTWANVPDANITQSSVTQHQAALSITESQISDLQSYLTTLGSIGGHTDVDISTAAPTDGQVLKWDNANSKFVPGDAASSVSNLTDVNLTGLTNNAVLKYDSINSEWVIATNNDTANATANAIVPFAFARVASTSNGSGIGISWSNWNSGNATLDFTFSTAQPDTNYFVVTDAETFDNYFVGITNKSTTGFRAEFYDDTQSRSPSSFSPFGFVIYSSSPTETITSTVGSTDDVSEGSTNLYHTDARALAATDGEIVKFANMFATINDLPNATTYHGMFAHVHSTGKGYYAHNGSWIELANVSELPTVPTSIDDLSDVDITTAAPTSGQVLKWNGSAFVPADDTDTTLTLGNESVDALSDVDTTTTAPTNGQALVWDGSNWVPGTVASSGGSSVTVSDAAPSSPSEGDMWFDSTNLTMMVYYDSFWVEATTTADTHVVQVSDTAPAAAVDNTLWWNSADGNLYVYYDDGDSTQWVQANSSDIQVAVDDLSNVSAASPTDGQALVWSATNSQWEAGTIAGGTDLSTATTDDLAEGSTNLYYTDTRVGTYLTSNSYATETFVSTAVSNLVDAAPTTLDTLNELAAALGDDPNFATTITTSIGTKWTEDTAKITNWDTAYSWGDHSAAGYLTSETTTSLALASNTLTYTDETGATTNISLAAYLDDTTNTVASGTLSGNTITFTRQDSSTFTVDVTALYDDTNLVTSVNGQTGAVTITTYTDADADARIAAASIGDLSDVDITTTAPTDGQTIVWDNANSKFIPGSAGGSSVAYGSTAPSSPSQGDLWFDTTDGELYVYNGSAWVTTHPVAAPDLSQSSIDDLSDVDTSSSAPSNGDLLIWNATNTAWEPGAAPATYSDSDAISAITSADLDMGTNKILYSNVYATTGDLPSASSYHGMFAHVHAEGRGYFAHAGSWVPLANQSELPSLSGYATETYVDTAVANLVDTAPTTLDTLNELAAALGDDPNFATTITNQIATKADSSSVPTALTDLGITDGSSGQVLTTDGSGSFTFTTVASGSSGASVTTGVSAPSSPSNGDLWFDTDEAILYLYYDDGTSAQWVQTTNVSAGGDTSHQWIDTNANYTALSSDRVFVDCSGGAVTVDLPANPSQGTEVRIIDATGNAATNNITINRNGNNIEGAAEDLVIDVDRAAFGLVYYNATQGWLFMEK